MSKQKAVIFDAMGVVFVEGNDTVNLTYPYMLDRNPDLELQVLIDAYIEAAEGRITSEELWNRCGFTDNIAMLEEDYLDTMLELIDGSVPLIVELKNGRRNQELCEKCYDLLRDYRGEYCIESFNPLIVGWFRRNAREVFRGQLAGRMDDYKGSVKKPLALLLSRCMLNIVSRPQFIAYHIGKKPLTVRLSEAMGAVKIAYTATDESSEAKNDAVIFEHYKPRLKYK